MEPSKRKRRVVGVDGDDDNRRRPSSNPRPADVAHPQVNNDEVEEFFSILCRMRDATRSIGVRRKAPQPAPALPLWSPTFVPEDFEGPDPKGDRRLSADRAEEEHGAPPLCLDLNADPEPEFSEEENPCCEAATRCARRPA
ncbi:protein NEGATIVE REGULATOR OF RESISTANCE-like [Zingiber officinale]|uniref:Uncharacterized protein n=1 Tax=Zingiber officinale TaxID=94328 RepID=A0A8J5GH81_ZINOF|nr:protein NEGATIVE REGULATOR OF RESISTANCE-like [Zingiber officinale]KAG6500372.1 hypothetical protein ZIOFF_040217 [Zingiber officinale]